MHLLETLANGMSRLCKKKTTVHAIGSAKGSNRPKSSEKEPVSVIGALPPSKERTTDTVEMCSMKTTPTRGLTHSMSPGDGSKIYTTICGLQSVAFVVTVSDAMHNFTDGLAIGAAFAKSPATGLATSIAVVCHELPHEVGDFAILLSTGNSVKRALLLNFLSALTCFAGVYPGIAFGQNDTLRQWIFAAVAGGFLYVALVHMLHEIKEFGPLPRYVSVALQNIGLLLGFIIILILAVYEDKIHEAL